MTQAIKGHRFPSGSYYILWNIIFDRMTTGGFLAILAIYLHQKLNFDTSTSTALYHINEFIIHLFAIFGAIIADCYWGIFKTLIKMSILIAISGAVVTIATFEFSFLNIRVMSFIGLTFAMIGIGSMKSNQVVFVGNQFKMPEQSNDLEYFLSIHYLVIKCGVLLGMILIPILRTEMKCFGEDDCYPLAFGVITASMILALTIFRTGKKKFVHVPASGENVLVKVLKCISFAFYKKIVTSSSSIKKDHWLDYSEEKFGKNLVEDTKSLLHVLVMYLPLPIYWALLGQQASRWVFQATRMNGDIGWYTIKPDQMIVLGPFFMTILIPLFNQMIFPAITKIGIKSNLQKMCCGMVCASISFMISAYIEVQISQHYISILWLFPQYLIIAISEVLLWVPNVAFAYKEAKQSMKSVLTASVYLSVGGGCLIVFAISGLRLFSSLAHELMFYAIIMIVDAMIFAVLAWRYKYRESGDHIENFKDGNKDKV